MKIRIEFVVTCEGCTAEFRSLDEVRATQQAAECEALGGHDFKFAVGDRICDNSQRAEGPSRAKVVAHYLQVRTHEPIYLVQVEGGRQQEWLAHGIEPRVALINEPN